MLLTLYTLPQLAVAAKILCLLMVVICGAVPSTVRSVALYSHCSHGHLNIYPNNTVMAKDNELGEQYQSLTISSEGLDLKLLIYSPVVERYLCFNPKWRLHGMKITREQALRRARCRFYENMVEGYNTYQSVADHRRYITFNGHGVQPGEKRSLSPSMRKCRGFIKKDSTFSIQEHNSRIAGKTDMNVRTVHHKKPPIPKRGKLRYPDKLRHSRHLRRKKHYNNDTT